MVRRVLKKATQAPWSLAIGDVKENVEELVGLEQAPPELISQKIWQLYRTGPTGRMQYTPPLFFVCFRVCVFLCCHVL